jgi:hypothetical protein
MIYFVGKIFFFRCKNSFHFVPFDAKYFEIVFVLKNKKENFSEWN